MIAALRSRSRALAASVVFGGFVAASFFVAVSLVFTMPEGLADLSEAERTLFRGELVTPSVVFAAIAAGLYSAFDYTDAVKRGVIARESALQRRSAVLVARAATALVGGAVVGAACGVGVVVAAGIGGAGLELSGPLLASAAGMGVVVALWGFALAVLVRRHLVALFVVTASLGVAVPLGEFLPDVASWLPLPLFMETVGADAAALVGSPAPAPQLLATAWLIAAAGAATISFQIRDVP